MDIQYIDISLTVNDASRKLSVGPDDSLLAVLRRASSFSVKYGCDDDTCGVCTVLPNGKPVHPPDEEGLFRARTILGDIVRVILPASGSFDLSRSESLVDEVVGIITRYPLERKS